jgi:hypothetical protein
MKFQVTAIEFDFEEGDGFPEHQFSNVTDEDMVWVAEDEDDLVDEITWATGWCVKSLEYVVLPDEEVKLKSGRSVFV